MPKVPVTFLGVDTSPVPGVVCEQMNLAKGFGLVVDYVVPDSPAAAAGLQQNDILKMFNDQILLEPNQLAKLVRSNSEGATVTLTILRKGKEEKVSVKLMKKEVPQREMGRHRGDMQFGDHDFGDLGERMRDLKAQLGDAKEGMIHDAVMKAHQEAERVRDEVQRVSEHAREEARRAAEQIKISHSDAAGLKTTKIDIAKAQIVFADDKGELRMENVDGKKMLTAKDPQGRLLFSGPIDMKEDLDKVPADVRQRYENLQQRDLPSVVSTEDENDGDDDADDDNDDADDNAPSTEQVSWPQRNFPHTYWIDHAVLI